MIGPVRPHRFGDLGDEAHPVRFGAAIFVGALVGSLRQELMHEIAVRAVQFQHVEAGFMRAPRRVAPGLHQVFHLLRSSAFGTGHFSLWAIALGATGDQASQSSMSGVRCSGRSPSHGRVARALRPEWPS